MQNVLVMDYLDPLYQLLSHLQYCSQRELLTILDEEILETGSEKIHQHYVVLSLCGDGVDLTRCRGTLGIPGTLPKELRYL